MRERWSSATGTYSAWWFLPLKQLLHLPMSSDINNDSAIVYLRKLLIKRHDLILFLSFREKESLTSLPRNERLVSVTSALTSHFSNPTYFKHLRGHKPETNTSKTTHLCIIFNQQEETLHREAVRANSFNCIHICVSSLHLRLFHLGCEESWGDVREKRGALSAEPPTAAMTVTDDVGRAGS